MAKYLLLSIDLPDPRDKLKEFADDKGAGKVSVEELILAIMSQEITQIA